MHLVHDEIAENEHDFEPSYQTSKGSDVESFLSNEDTKEAKRTKVGAVELVEASVEQANTREENTREAISCSGRMT